MSTRRDFLKTSGAVAVGATMVSAYGVTAAREGAAQERGAGNAKGGSAALLRKDPDHGAPATEDRLPLDWHKGRIKMLQQKLGERGLDGMLISDRNNIIYYTGLFHTTTERPFAVFIPTTEMALYWFHPGLDNSLVGTWWGEREYYYDYPHAEGGFPDQRKVAIGPAVDLLAWQLTGIRKRGFGDKKIALSEAPSESKLKHMLKILPKATFEPVGESICVKMRRVKTPEEIALTYRAYNYFSRIHAWTRDYILQHGTDLTDHKIHVAAEEYGTDLVMKDIKRDGHPHTAVGIGVNIGCRTGVGTAYPHPNQFHHNRVKKGDSLQVSGVVRIGGCGGEMYSPYQLAPWNAEREKVWEVMAEGSAMQVKLSKAGTRCQDVAKAIHEMQVKNGMEKYLYQRIGHGEGTEGHQEPYIALGDETVLEEGMTFSMEPGLFNPEGGYGYNPSNNVLVAKHSGIAMGSVPLTKEWCFVTL